MFTNYALSGLLTATAALGLTIRDTDADMVKFGCGTREPEDYDIEFAAYLSAEEEAAARIGANLNARATLEVDVYMHVVWTSSSGAPSEDTIKSQLDVMNEDFAPSDIHFNLQDITYTVDSNWGSLNNSGDEYEYQMKQSLREGDYKTLNLYFLEHAADYLGWCTFGMAGVKEGSSDYYWDGCVIEAGTLPGGDEIEFNLGKTAVHEVGHWFNLYHTFQGGCSGSGDFISDTPAQKSPTQGCPVGRDSCPAAPGLDPIHNYMDYSYDSCYEEFTAGQKTRMHAAFAQR